eukprot:115030-Rhodomonas_salina.1
MQTALSRSKVTINLHFHAAKSHATCTFRVRSNPSLQVNSVPGLRLFAFDFAAGTSEFGVKHDRKQRNPRAPKQAPGKQADEELGRIANSKRSKESETAGAGFNMNNSSFSRARRSLPR